ncbi:SDR family NAD(P)-dependent oxidoreductase [Brevundimonas sp.]|uniref:SDR family NAD(P)-dependent oxidoreductase n=1 Tax=Brevundimonas sp. TaxID=1871086 RepID=UPI003BAD5FF5
MCLAAGISLGEKEMEWASYRKVLDIQLDGVFKTIELSRPLLAKTKGSIITISSMFAYFGGGTSVAYSSAKGAIVQMTKSLAGAYADDGIRVNSVAPGWIKTPLLEKVDTIYPGSTERLLHRTPMNRFGEPVEVAQVIAFLASRRGLLRQWRYPAGGRRLSGHRDLTDQAGACRTRPGPSPA